MPHAEPVELLTVGLAVMAMLAGLHLLVQAIQTARDVDANGRCEAIRVLARGRVENEVLRGCMVLLVLIAGVSQATTPMPVAGSPLRWWFQLSWAMIAGLNLVMSLRNERRVRQLIDIIERERAAGRMG